MYNNSSFVLPDSYRLSRIRLRVDEYLGLLSNEEVINSVLSQSNIVLDVVFCRGVRLESHTELTA